MNLPAVMLSAIPAIIAACFLFMFCKDHDKRKLIAAVSISFMSLSSAVEIFGLPQSFYVLNNLYWWGDLPVIAALILLFVAQLLNLKIYKMAIRIFSVAFVVTLLILFIPGSMVISGITVDFLGLIALCLSSYLFLKRRRFVDTLFLLSILSFDVYGYSWGTTVGVTFSLACYAASFLFVGLAFGFAPVEKPWDNGSVFKVTKQLDKAKERLKELEIEYKTIFESANDAIFVVDVQTGLILDCNNEATMLLEVKKEEIVGKNEKTLFPNQNDIVMSRSFLKQAPGASGNVELQVVTCRGEVKDVAAKLRSFEHAGEKLLVGVFRDVTEQKRNAKDLALALEYLSSQNDKVQALNEKLRVVGGLTRHDVRNKLMVANNNAYILRKRIADQSELMKYLEGIESAIKQCEKLFEFSRLFEKIGAEELSEVRVEDCFNQAAGIIAKPEITVLNKCSGLKVVADKMLIQLFYNLIDNSQKHGTAISQIILHYVVDEGNTILYYEDNGIGIPIENKERIFSEGFTTGGSGLGLKLVKKMIEAYGWTIEENGVPGKGARFKITIPMTNAKIEEQKISMLPNLEPKLTLNSLPESKIETNK